MWRSTVVPDVTCLGPWIRRFLIDHLEMERNLALNTRKSYRDMLALLLPFAAARLHRRADELTVLDLKPELVRAFLEHLERQRRCQIRTRNQRLGAIHAFARFVGEHSPEHLDWCARVRLIPYKKCSGALVGYLTEDEMQALLAAPNQATDQGRRDYALLLFLYNSGARASEATSLQIRDVDQRARNVRIVGKGGKQRICPLWKSTLGVIRSLTRGRDGTDALFINRCGQPLTRFGVHTLVERTVKKASISAPSLRKKQVSPHVIRHATATHLLRAGIDINTIRGWLGHASINTTNIYAEIDLETKARALSACQSTANPSYRKPWKADVTVMDFLRNL